MRNCIPVTEVTSGAMACPPRTSPLPGPRGSPPPPPSLAEARVQGGPALVTWAARPPSCRAEEGRPSLAAVCGRRPRSRAAGAPGCSGRNSTRALPCECLGHRGPSTAGLDRGMGAKTAHLHRSRRSDSRRAARAASTRTSEKRASAGGLGDQKETSPPPKGGIFVVSSDINGLFIDPEQLGNMLSMPKQVLSNSSRVVCSTHKSLQDLVPAPTSREVMAC